MMLRGLLLVLSSRIIPRAQATESMGCWILNTNQPYLRQTPYSVYNQSPCPKCISLNLKYYSLIMLYISYIFMQHRSKLDTIFSIILFLLCNYFNF